jgi:hypothetical protein
LIFLHDKLSSLGNDGRLQVIADTEHKIVATSQGALAIFDALTTHCVE